MEKESIKEFLEIKLVETRYSIGLYLSALSKMTTEVAKLIPGYGLLLIFDEKLNNTIEMNGINAGIEALKIKTDEIQRLQKIDDKYIKNSKRELYFLFKTFLGSVYNQPDEECIQLLSYYTANCINVDYNEVKLKISLLNKLAKYSKTHIDILKALYVDWNDCDGSNNYKYENNDIERQIKKINFVNKSTFLYCAHDLLNDGFLFQVISTWLSNSYSPFQISETGIIALKMMDKI